MVIIAVNKATKRAKLKHKCSFDEFNAYKTEVPILLLIRGLLGIPAYIFLFDWLLPISLFPWSYLNFPIYVTWIGFILLTLSTILLIWSLNSIKTNYHGTNGLHKNHELVTSGAYKFIRHPIEISFLFVHISIFLLTSNWTLGILLVTLGLVILLVRTPVEESYLINRFGNEYLKYMEITGKYFPKFK